MTDVLTEAKNIKNKTEKLRSRIEKVILSRLPATDVRVVHEIVDVIMSVIHE